MDRVIDDIHLANIGNALRETLGEEQQFPPEDMGEAIKYSNEVAFSNGYGSGFEEGEEFGYNTGFADGDELGYQAGMEQGRAEGIAEGIEEGRALEQRAFWEVFQQGGKRTAWQYAFAYNGWSDENYNPIYPIRIPSTNTNMYYDSPITSTKVSLDASDRKLNYTFRDSSIETIPELIVNKSTELNNGFTGCTKLKNITITGTLGKSVTMNACPLSIESIKNIISCLKDYSSEAPFTYTLTLKDSCKTALEGDTETVSFNGEDYTYFELITAKGWNLA